MKNKILIVEDNFINRNILSRILRTEYEIMEAADGIEALAVIEAQYQELSAVILDLVMPNMDGRQLMEILSRDEKYANLPILIATGEHNEEVESECLQSGAWDFITKPYNPIVLCLRLRNVIGRSQIHLMKQIQALAERDMLTGIYNRRFFMRKTAAMLAEHPDEQFVMIRMDVDQFRLYNSSFGSAAGDELIKMLAVRIEEWLTQLGDPVRTFGRIDADIFAICIPYKKEQLEEGLLRLERIVQGLVSSYTLKVSFGLYVIEKPDLEMEKIYADATEAVRKCKNNINKIYAYYNEEMGKQEEKAQQYTNEIRRAMEERQFLVYLQPKYSIEDNVPCGAEALVRWKHPEWGMVSPGEFIPVFEQNGLIVQLDYYMWESVCMILKKWMDEGREALPVSVNVSRISLYNPQITDKLVGLTEKYQIPRHLLNLEITESAYMSNPDLMRETIGKLRESGFVILMDDFGSGYSSLNTLKDIDVDILKIDMKFLPTGHNNAKSEKILASITRMAGWLGMPVVVEGVETRDQRDFLESIGCHYIQGFYYARPMPLEEYEDLLDRSCLPLTMEKHKDAAQAEDFELIWSSDSKVAALLKSVSVPFMIFEYADFKIDILRMNQVYIQLFGGGELDRYLMAPEMNRFQSAVEDLAHEGKNQECECLFIMPDGTSRWYQIRLNQIGVLEKASLVSATFCDVTAERMLERELSSIFRVLRENREERRMLLVVDDQEISRQIVRTTFEADYVILEAEDGRQGLELLKAHSNEIAAILLDMIMPNLGGQEFLVYKNKMPEAADIPVIVISSENDEATQVHMLENGVNDYVIKPFVPAIARKRLRNVMEYNSRFRTLVREYQNSGGNQRKKKEGLQLSGYSRQDLREIVRFMGEIFDLVRLVDPKQTAVVTIQPDGSVEREPYSCFRVWGKTVRCENCSSLCAQSGQCGLNKFELLQQEVFYVVSQPVRVQLDRDQEELVLEIASRISGEQLPMSDELKNMYQWIKSIKGKIYMDPLTNVYNRRYLDEMLFLYNGKDRAAERVAVIIFDLNQFKMINDLFGHQEGDQVLKKVAEGINAHIRQGDSLIRYGGDEFIVILTDCEEAQIAPYMERLKRVINQVKYGPSQTIAADADFGCAYTEQFRPDMNMLDEMIRTADERMYEKKRRP